jgi:putative Mn2+ efflux pump MntP
MENFKNIATTILMTVGTTMSFLDAFEQWARIIAACVTTIVGLITIIRNIKNVK